MKYMRKILVCLLVFMLVMSMGSPALAASGEGTRGQYSYEWTLTKETDRAVAEIWTVGQPTSLGAYAFGKHHNADNDVDGYTDSNLRDELYDFRLESHTYSSGYASLTATAFAKFTYNGVVVRGETQEAYGSFWVNGSNVVSGATQN